MMTKALSLRRVGWLYIQISPHTVLFKFRRKTNQCLARDLTGHSSASLLFMPYTDFTVTCMSLCKPYKYSVTHVLPFLVIPVGMAKTTLA